jgi:hypothetical protein
MQQEPLDEEDQAELAAEVRTFYCCCTMGMCTCTSLLKICKCVIIYITASSPEAYKFEKASSFVFELVI